MFDPETGDVVKKPRGQGYAEGSSWTRGQSWAICGFAMSYHYTKNEKYLKISKKVAKYFMENTKDYMPIDFRQPVEPKYIDSSAAAISAYEFLEIISLIYGDFYMLEALMRMECDVDPLFYK